MTTDLLLALIFGTVSGGFLGWSVTRAILPKIQIPAFKKNYSMTPFVINHSQKILFGGVLICLLITLLADFFLGLLLLIFFLLGWLVYQKGPKWKLERELKK